MIPFAAFGYILVFIFIVIPVCILLLILWIVSRKIIFGKAILGIFAGIICLTILSSVLGTLTSKIELEKNDYYGTYIIDRDQFPGKQSDWQYNSFRFEIKTNDSIYFYYTDGEYITKTYKGTISTVKPYNSERLVLYMAHPKHHILTENPTTYRETQDFYLVFESPEFKNVFFKKGSWKPLKQ